MPFFRASRCLKARPKECVLPRSACEEGLEHRYGPDWRNLGVADDTGKEKSVLNSTRYEADIIIQQGFPSLLPHRAGVYPNGRVSQGIGVGPGRGSAAGATRGTYAMGITDLDPHSERPACSNASSRPERVEMPDIDVDFEQGSIVEEVINHIQGCLRRRPRVAGVITFGTLQAKNAVRDAARVLDYPYSTWATASARLIGGRAGHHHRQVRWRPTPT